MKAIIIILLAVVVTAGIRAGTNEIRPLETNYFISDLCWTGSLGLLTGFVASSEMDVYIYEGTFTNAIVVKGTNGTERIYNVVGGELKEVKK